MATSPTVLSLPVLRFNILFPFYPLVNQPTHATCSLQIIRLSKGVILLICCRTVEKYSTACTANFEAIQDIARWSMPFAAKETSCLNFTNQIYRFEGAIWVT